LKQERERHFLDRIGRAVKAHKDGDGVPCSFAEFKRLYDACLRWRRLTAEAANHVESTLCLRTHFRGDPSYVGWKGLGLALQEALDARDIMRAALEHIANHNDGASTIAKGALARCKEIYNRNPPPERQVQGAKKGE